MPKRMTSSDLDHMQQMLDQGRISDFYDTMGHAGYHYADWANGVVKTDTLAGLSAVDYLTGSAMMGLGLQSCRNLDEGQLQNIKGDMAQAYLDQLRADAARNGGAIDRDLDSKEVYDIHKEVFEHNGVGIGNWTLDAPFKVIEKLYGRDAVESVWNALRDTGGGDLTSSAYNTALWALMQYESRFGDADLKALAQQWLDNVSIPDALTKRLNQLLPSDLISRFPEFFGGGLTGQLPVIAKQVHDKFQGSQKSSSPLVFDLDGDGIEIALLSERSTALFDLNADGRRTQMAWAATDDAFLALDRDGNGAIDSGQELFGDQTLLASGKKAADGYAALAELDGNKDGVIDAADARFQDLRLWRDLDQDGVSDAGELVSLSQAGITRISLDKTSGSQTLADGTRLDGSASFTLADGSVRRYTDAWLAENPFRSAFRAGTAPLPDQAAALPQMQGAGAVRDLRTAAAQSPALATLLGQFQQAGTRDAQRALLDPLLQAWADTSDFVTVSDWQASGHSVSFSFYGQDAAGNALWQQRLSVLETFNGENYRTLAKTGTTAISTASARQALLEQSYDALSESVYGALVTQTRLQPYLAAITVEGDDEQVRIDSNGVGALLATRHASDAQGALTDLVELERYATPVVMAAGFDGTAMLRDWIAAAPADAPWLAATLGDLDVQWGDATVGTKADDIYVGNARANRYSGGDGDDLIDGGAGNDRLYGRDGDDTLLGGEGNDVLEGDAGRDWLTDASLTSSDTYIWGRGMGADTASDAGGTDRLDIGSGVTADQLWLSRDGDDLTFGILGTEDRLTVRDWYAGSAHQIEAVRLADGKTLDARGAQALVEMMATLPAPASSATTAPADQAALQALIASSWH